MPTPISKWEVNAGSVGFVGGLPPGTGAEADRGIAVFDPLAGFGVRYSLQCFLLNNAFSTDLNSVYTAAAYYPFNPSYSVGTADTPMLWTPILIPMTVNPYQIVLNDSGASFLGGGTIAIEKDYDNGHIIFVTPGGNLVVPFDIVPTVTPGIGPWSDAPGTVGLWHSLYWGGLSTSISVSESVVWTNFRLSSNSTPVDGAAMTAADPGSWDLPLAIFDQDPSSDVQQTLGYLARFTYAPPPTIHDNGRFSEYRKWRNSQRGLGTDLTRAPEHGSIYGALVYTADPTLLRFRATYDNGTTWAEKTLFTDGASMNTTPSIAWHEGILYVVWQKGTDLVQSKSSDLGATFSMPVTLSISGTNPELLIDPSHGLAYYFFVDGSNNLVLMRSGTFGNDFIDATPIVVVASITPQTVAAELASDGSLVVGYIAGGVWTQVRSKDLGISWI